MGEKNDEREDEITENKENDAREEDIVKDADADTRDIEAHSSAETEATMSAIKSVLSMVEDLAAKVDKISSAQEVMATNARIVDHDLTPVSEQVSRMETDDVPNLKDFDLSV